MLHVDNIQGNILGGFSKDFQTLVFLKIRRARAFKKWLKPKIPSIATVAEVVAFNRLYKSMRYRLKGEPGLKVTWVNIAFSYKGLQKLGAINLKDDFVDDAFKQGLASRSKQDLLGDPIGDPKAKGHPKNWLVGGPQSPVDVILIVAGDDQDDVQRTVTEWLQDGRPALELVGFRGSGRESGQNLPAELAGHEHFGFLDGVSQPGIRGRLSENAHDVLTIRQNPNNPDQGKPGQDLIWPGEFVFGYPGEDPRRAFRNPGAVVSAGPAWADDGSFLVFRRLRQDVAGFHKFLKAKSREVRDRKAPAVTADLLGAQLVGRWRSGAPLMRTKSSSQSANDTDIPTLGDNDCANNNFEFQSKTAPLPGSPQDPLECTDGNTDPPPRRYPHAASDLEGLVCPFTSHIRKVYPRDDQRLSAPPPQAGGTFPLNENDTQTHRILRRGIPYGPPLRRGRKFSTPERPADDDKLDRGLHFLCYQTSIERQFEFIIRNWVNNANFKEPSNAAVERRQRPPNERGGHDPIIGQNNAAGENRVRSFNVAIKNEAGHRIGKPLTSGVDWVIPTGGGYFFAPSLKALKTRLT